VIRGGPSILSFASTERGHLIVDGSVDRFLSQLGEVSSFFFFSMISLLWVKGSRANPHLFKIVCVPFFQVSISPTS